MIFTIGHSTRSIETFLKMLRVHSVTLLEDVRTVPGSRHNPQYGSAPLEAALHDAGIGYIHRSDLGGLRRPRPDSPNNGWRNDSFRGYADYMQSEAFVTALEKLVRDAGDAATVIMCAEAVPWRCHRSLIADALLVRGIPVQHIMSETRAQPHEMTSFAVVDGTRITYPAQPDQFSLM